MYTKIKILLLILAANLQARTSYANLQLGIDGVKGQSALEGDDGKPGLSLSLNVGADRQVYDLRGENGGDASGVAEKGGPAWNCQQLSVSSNLIGASGGAGGDSARGGHGGDGGEAKLYLSSSAQLSLLKNITIMNSGGKAGLDSLEVGEGGPPCYCQYPSWSVIIDEKTGESVSYSCTHGLFGAKGKFMGSAENGSFGWVKIIQGTDSNVILNPEMKANLGSVVDRSYLLSTVHYEKRRGLRPLLSEKSLVADEYLLGSYFRRTIKWVWKAGKSPSEAGLENAKISASLKGPSEKPNVILDLPANLRREVLESADTTVVTITHVLNSSDPAKISACAKYDKKGSNLCEFSGGCYYEVGYCLPK